jgi:hypothetical protein
LQATASVANQIDDRTGELMRTPLPPIADRFASQAVKGAVGVQVQKLIDSQVARATGPLIERIEELERKVAVLENQAKSAPSQIHRSDDI